MEGDGRGWKGMEGGGGGVGWPSQGVDLKSSSGFIAMSESVPTRHHGRWHGNVASPPSLPQGDSSSVFKGPEAIR